MSRYRTVTVDVDIDLSEFDDDDLIEEVQRRGHSVITGSSVWTEESDDMIRERAEKVYWQIRDGAEASAELRQLISHITGRIL